MQHVLMAIYFVGPLSETPESQNLDYDYAQEELMLAQMGSDPVQEAISSMEKQHEDEKQGNMHNRRKSIC